MIFIDNVTVEGLETAIRAMRNPKNSWSKSDSGIVYEGVDEIPMFRVGDEDMALALKLVRSGTDHSKFMRMISAAADLTAPLYWWKEFDTYRFGVEKNSCSTMHTLHKSPITLADFSMEDANKLVGGSVEVIIDALETLRKKYLEEQDRESWRAMIQLLPESFMQMRTAKMSYAALRNMYKARRFHKLSEWRRFCSWIETLPCSRLITEGIGNDYS